MRDFDRPWMRVTLLVVTAFTALTAAAGGGALMWGSLSGGSSPIIPPGEYLQGSPFTGYLVPGTLLLVGIAGTHAVAFLACLRRRRWAPLAVVVAGYACLVWIFVQMVFIPFSALQALYFGIGCLELGLTLLALRVWPSAPPASR